MSHLSPSDVTAIFLSLGVLLATARVLGEISRRFGQPAVVGELFAGILLGPTVLGRFAPEFAGQLVPIEGNAGIVLDGITTLAICLFLLVAGMEVELSTVWRRGRTALSVAVSGFAIPFAIGLAVAWVAPYALGCEVDANPRIFALFFATAISISALPVIAKTLMDLGLYRSDFGMIVIAAAIFNDLIGWLVFAVILAMLGTEAAHGYGVVGTIVFTIACAAFALTIGRWLVHRILPWVQAYTSWPGGVLGFAMSLALLAAALTEWIGIHAIFGAFLVGVIIGDSSHLRHETRRTILDFVSFIFAPLFFASVGLRIDFAAKFYPDVIIPVLVIGCLSKIGGCGLTARLTGLDWNTSWALGFALNARGAMEIILGLLALQNGLIRQRMFVALVILAVVTSMMSGPGIQRFLGRRRRERLVDFLVPQAFRAGLAAQNVQQAHAELLQTCVAAGLITSQAAHSLLEPDALPVIHRYGKVAVLQSRLTGLQRSYVAIGISSSGINVDESDSEAATTICLILAPAANLTEPDSLEAQIAHTFADPEVLQEASQAATFTEFLAVVRSQREQPSEVVAANA
jgi:Kef-type K+ transport system membrane component KefB